MTAADTDAPGKTPPPKNDDKSCQCFWEFGLAAFVLFAMMVIFAVAVGYSLSCRECRTEDEAATPANAMVRAASSMDNVANAMNRSLGESRRPAAVVKNETQ